MTRHYYTHPNDDLQKIIEKKHDWEQTRTELKYIRNSIYQKLSDLYGNKCYYCKMRLDSGSNPGDIEHIIYKGNENYKEFSYHPLNLTLTCKRCNTAKGVKDCLDFNKQNIKYEYNDYPQNSNDFTIVHTHLDNYEEHLELEENIFIVPKNSSQKGIKTIEICNLYRLDLALGRVKEIRNTWGMGGPAKELVMQGRRSNDEIKQALLKWYTEDETDKFQALMNIGGNSNSLQIVNELAKIEDVTLIAIDENYSFFQYFMEQFDIIDQYYNLTKYINDTTTLYIELKNLILEEHLLNTTSSKIILNSNGLQKLNEWVYEEELDIRKTVNEKLKEYLRNLDALDIDFINRILDEKLLFLKLINVVSKILTNDAIKYLFPGLVNFDFRFINQDINKFSNKFDGNPQLKLLYLLEWYYQQILTSIDREIFFKNKRRIRIIINYLES